MTRTRETRRPASDPWTREQIIAHCQNRALTNVDNLAKATGIGTNALYDAIARGEWTATRVLRVGRLIKIPTADILALIESGGDAA